MQGAASQEETESLGNTSHTQTSAITLQANEQTSPIVYQGVCWLLPKSGPDNETQHWFGWGRTCHHHDRWPRTTLPCDIKPAMEHSPSLSRAVEQFATTLEAWTGL